MKSIESQPLYTVDEYLALERGSEERHEFLDGHIFAMAGESGAHADICTNLVREISNQLRGTPCRVRSKDTKVRSGPDPAQRRTIKGLFSYPDLVVICGEPEYHDQHRDVVLNPKVIIEVLSESTEAFDRGGKFLRYQAWNPTLTDYILVSQSGPVIEHYVRQRAGGWSYYPYTGLEQSLTVESINCTLRFGEVYDRVVFPAEDVEIIDEEESPPESGAPNEE
ncbi:MAG: Uma2 family endonuclease [Blastocatellia bacterium]|nr:Uma2 family endonuclease [Blastocatellia bacterium]